jgi:hypothetical protein
MYPFRYIVVCLDSLPSSTRSVSFHFRLIGREVMTKHALLGVSKRINTTNVLNETCGLPPSLQHSILGIPRGLDS